MIFNKTVFKTLIGLGTLFALSLAVLFAIGYYELEMRGKEITAPSLTKSTPPR